MGFVFPTCVLHRLARQYPSVSAGQVSSLKMVAKLLILPAGFGRFLPRWQMIQEEDLHSRVDVRERSLARNLAYIDGEPELRQLQCEPAPVSPE